VIIGADIKSGTDGARGADARESGAKFLCLMLPPAVTPERIRRNFAACGLALSH
jgi:hypothetical protein